MKYLKFIFFVGLVLLKQPFYAQPGCPPNANLGNLAIIPPIKNPYCKGDNIDFQFNSTFPIISSNWTYSGLVTNAVVIGNTYKLTGLLSAGITNVQGIVFANGRNCNYTFSRPGNFSSLAANAGIDKPINAGQPQVGIGASPTAVNGSSPYTYLWTPNSNFVSGSNQTQSNPNVNPTTNVMYQVQVTDATGCTATDDVDVVQTYSYGELKKTLDAGYYQVFAGKLYFAFDGEYNTSTQLKYKIYNTQRGIRADYSAFGAPALAVKIGDNRYILNLTTSFSFSATDNNNFFTLEVTNEKNELFVLKFKYAN